MFKMACHARGHSELVKWRLVAVAKWQRFIRTIHQGSLVHSTKCFTSKAHYFLLLPYQKCVCVAEHFYIFTLSNFFYNSQSKLFRFSKMRFCVSTTIWGTFCADKMVHQTIGILCCLLPDWHLLV